MTCAIVRIDYQLVMSLKTVVRTMTIFSLCGYNNYKLLIYKILNQIEDISNTKHKRFPYTLSIIFFIIIIFIKNTHTDFVWRIYKRFLFGLCALWLNLLIIREQT